jgi:hypothetical protein
MSVETKTEVDLRFSSVTEFKNYLKTITESVNGLLTLTEKVHDLKDKEVLMVGGVQIDKSSLRSMRSDINNKIKELYKAYSAGKAKKSKAPANGAEPKVRKNGFDNPVYVSKHVVDFFTKNAASLGVDAKTARALASTLQSLSTKNLTTSNILTKLWSIYALHTQKDKIVAHSNEVDSKGKPKVVSYYHADDNMKQCFGASGSNTFAFLSAKPQKTGKNEKLLPIFTPDHFAYTAWQSIYSHNKLSEAGVFTLSAEQAANLKNMNEWKNLSTKKPETLTPEEKVYFQCVIQKGFAPNMTAEQQAKVRAYLAAKTEVDQLALENDAVSASLEAHKLASPAPVKKGRAKKAVAAPAVNGVPAGNGFLPIGMTAVPLMK